MSNKIPTAQPYADVVSILKAEPMRYSGLNGNSVGATASITISTSNAATVAAMPATNAGTNWNVTSSIKWRHRGDASL